MIRARITGTTPTINLREVPPLSINQNQCRNKVKSNRNNSFNNSASRRGSNIMELYGSWKSFLIQMCSMMLPFRSMIGHWMKSTQMRVLMGRSLYQTKSASRTVLLELEETRNLGAETVKPWILTPKTQEWAKTKAFPKLLATYFHQSWTRVACTIYPQNIVPMNLIEPSTPTPPMDQFQDTTKAGTTTSNTKRIWFLKRRSGRKSSSRLATGRTVNPKPKGWSSENLPVKGKMICCWWISGWTCILRMANETAKSWRHRILSRLWWHMHTGIMTALANWEISKITLAL